MCLSIGVDDSNGELRPIFPPGNPGSEHPPLALNSLHAENPRYGSGYLVQASGGIEFGRNGVIDSDAVGSFRSYILSGRSQDRTRITREEREIPGLRCEGGQS
jgi:hypothetical protein